MCIICHAARRGGAAINTQTSAATRVLVAKSLLPIVGLLETAGFQPERKRPKSADPLLPKIVFRSRKLTHLPKGRRQLDYFIRVQTRFKKNDPAAFPTRIQ